MTPEANTNSPARQDSPASETKIQAVLAEQPALAFAVLIGSRAAGTAEPRSDWDIAIAWKPGADAFQRLAWQERMRRRLAQTLGVSDSQVDLVDLRFAQLAMKAVVAEEGRLLYAELVVCLDVKLPIVRGLPAARAGRRGSAEHCNP